MKIGIIGNGFVGNSIAFGFSPTHEIRIHDKDPKRNLNTIEEVLECDVVFVAVPTPMNGNGAISLKIVESALKEISDKNQRNDNIMILKSTMVPGSTNNFIKQLLVFWTVKKSNFSSFSLIFTKGKSLSAQFEHTIGITENGYEIFTKSVKGYSKPPYL